jgi:hypothetical protein
MPKTLAQRFFQKSRSATLSVSPISGHGTRRHESSSRHSTILACKKAEIKRKTDLKRLIFPLQMAETEKEFKTTRKRRRKDRGGGKMLTSIWLRHAEVSHQCSLILT